MGAPCEDEDAAPAAWPKAGLSCAGAAGTDKAQSLFWCFVFHNVLPAIFHVHNLLPDRHLAQRLTYPSRCRLTINLMGPVAE